MSAHHVEKYEPKGISFPPANSIHLRIPDGLSFEEWGEIGSQLGIIELGINWWIGDWLNYGERRYGDMYEQATLETGREKQTLANLKWVASKFEVSLRREDLSWSHHLAVASLEPSVAQRMLDKAESEGWSVTTLREEVQGLKKAIPAPKAPPALPGPPDTETASTEPEEIGFDLTDALVDAQSRILALQAERDSLQKDDKDAEIARLHERLVRVEGHIAREQAKLVEAQRIIKSQSSVLERVRKVLGITSNSEIEGAIQDLRANRR